MSFSALNWAYEQNAPSGVAKSVLVYLANCASQEGGDCWPSVPKISQRVQHGEETVRKALAQLVEANLLEIEPRTAKNGRQMTHRYRLPVVSIATPPNSGGYARIDWDTPPKTGGYVNSQLLQGDPPETQGVTPPNSGGNPSEDTKEKEEVTSLRSARAHTSNVVELVDRVQSAVATWNEVCAPAGSPAIREVSPARRARIQTLMITRFNEPAAWRTFCQEIAASNFLTSKGLGVDWAIKPANLIKIIEGNYRNRVQRAGPRPGSASSLLAELGLPGIQPHFDPEPDDKQRVKG